MRKKTPDWNRYNFEGQGRTFLLAMGGLILVAMAAYILAHWWYPARLTLKDPRRLVQMDEFGRTSVISAEDIDWNVGKEKALPLMTEMEQRSQRIHSEVSALQEGLVGLRERFDPVHREGVFGISDQIGNGHFTDALRLLSGLREDLAPGTIGADGFRIIANVEAVLTKLEGLKREQLVALDNLRTPDRYVVFWFRPNLLLIEVAAWSLFGVMTSLLFHSGEFQRKKEFAPAERWVAYTKLLYTPLITVVLVLALWAGIIRIGGPESRVWLTPLLSFLVGFNARKAADLVDAISQWVLNRARDSLRRTDEEREAAREEQIAPILKAMPAQFLSDFRTEAKQQAKDELMREILGRELKL